MFLDTLAYVNACRDHLASSLKLADGSESPYYRKVDEETLEQAKEDISAVLNAQQGAQGRDYHGPRAKTHVPE